MGTTKLNALRYVKNTAGGARKSMFIEDHDPIGNLLWDDLAAAGLVCENAEGAVVLTDAGMAALEAQP